MNRKPVALRKHAILKHHYRRAVKATPQFHDLDESRRWAVLRSQVESDVTPTGATLLKIMDTREARRHEVLTALEAARQAHVERRAL